MTLNRIAKKRDANEPYSLQFELQGMPDLPNVLRRYHWGKRSRQARMWREMAHIKAKSIGVPLEPLKKATVRLTRLSAEVPDPDNLMASFKPLLDGLQDAGVIANDTIEVIGTPDVRWQSAKRGKGRVRVEVFEK